ncbi:MAG: response regulator [Deltaproteobacteria bacterium]|nr:MAG: response regulator [Deltaproteobacteria bacterium]
MKCRILLVDDEETMVKYLSKRLIKRGFDIRVAYNGVDALEIVKESEFDVVLLDVLMPGMDGIETLREIKKLKPKTEVIMLTGHASVEAGIEGMKSGAFNYIMKPFDPNELVTEINLAYEHRRIMKKGV